MGKITLFLTLSIANFVVMARELFEHSPWAVMNATIAGLMLWFALDAIDKKFLTKP